LSLSEVSKGTDISPSFLALVEKGGSDITISRLMRLVRWFGISLRDLVDDSDDSAVQVVRGAKRRSVYLADEQLSVMMLAGDGEHSMMPVLNVYSEGGGMADPARHDGEEFIFVLAGKIELTVGSADPIVLNRGDSAYYRADQPHSFRNAGKGEARFVGVTSPPNM
jgi:quercetin dioxygenase-like cupin family protein